MFVNESGKKFPAEYSPSICECFGQCRLDSITKTNEMTSRNVSEQFEWTNYENYVPCLPNPSSRLK